MVGLAGPIGSGKTSVAQGIANALKCPIVSFGTYVRELSARSGRGHSRQVLHEISEELIASLGLYQLTQNVLASIVWNRKQSLVVDGIRHANVIAALRAQVAPLPVIVVYLDARHDLRRERFIARDNLSAQEFDAFELHPIEQNVGTQVRALADLIVTADGPAKDIVVEVMNAIYLHLHSEINIEHPSNYAKK